MKKVLLFFAVLFALVLSSCTKFVETEHDRLLVKQDGLWGALWKDKVTIIIPWRNGGYGWLKEGATFNTQAIKCLYDSIIPHKYGDYIIFDAFNKDGKRCFNANLHPYAKGEVILDVKPLGSLFNGQACFEGTLFQFETAKGVYLQSVYQQYPDAGPYEDIYVGVYGYAYKQGGKWGFFFGRDDFNINQKYGGKLFENIVPAQYDGIIEVYDMEPTMPGHAHVSTQFEHIILARKGNIWVGFNERGKQVNISVSVVQATLKTEEWSPTGFDPMQRFRLGERVRRTGDTTRGVMVFK